jgi:hypothetical protein
MKDDGWWMMTRSRVDCFANGTVLEDEGDIVPNCRCGLADF